MEINEKNLNPESTAETSQKETSEKTKAQLSLESRRKANKETFAQFADKTPSQLQNDMTFRTLAANAVANELSHLPEGKYLAQKFATDPSNDIYTNVIGQVFDDMEQIPAGKGAEYILVNGLGVNTLDDTKFIPERNDIDQYSYVASIEIPSEIKKVDLSTSEWKYINYFLSGKVDEYAAKVKEQIEKTIALKQSYDGFQTLKNIFASVHAKAASTAVAPTNHFVGDVNVNIVDAVKELKDFVFDMMSHNKVFAADGTSFVGYNNAIESDLRFVVDKQTFNNITKIATTFLTSKELLSFANWSQWVVLPTTIFNPNTKAVEPLNILVDSNGNRVAGAILILSRTGLKRLYNLESAYAQFYPNNLTTQSWGFTRYTQGVLPWAQVGVFENKALEQEFVIPTVDKTPVGA